MSFTRNVYHVRADRSELVPGPLVGDRNNADARSLPIFIGVVNPVKRVTHETIFGLVTSPKPQCR